MKNKDARLRVLIFCPLGGNTVERKDCLWQDGPCFYFDTDLFTPTTDSFALGYFAAPRRGERVCDLGSGTGLLGTLLLAREPSLTLFCVEQNAAANALARKGFAENGRAERVTLRVGDLRDPSALPAAGSMDYAVSNPPYFPVGSGASAADGARQTAREEVGCTLADVCAAAARILRWGGRFALVHRPERLTDLLCTLRAHGLEPKRLRFVVSAPESTPSLLLAEARRGGRSGLTVEPPLIIGSPEWDRVYFRA